jgi:hypothetical protein
MNINGRDVQLKLIRQSNGSGRIGSKDTLTYVAGNIRVVANWVVTRVCRPDDESCESTGYKGTFVIERGSSRLVVEVLGDCGC